MSWMKTQFNHIRAGEFAFRHEQQYETSSKHGDKT